MAGKIIAGPQADGLRLKARAIRVIEGIMSRQWDGDKRQVRRGILQPPPISAFTGLEPLGFFPEEGDWFLFLPEDVTPSVIWPVRAGMVLEKQTGELVMLSARSIEPREVRGAVTRFGPRMLRIDNAQTEPDGHVRSFVQILVWLGGKWAPANGHLEPSGAGAPPWRLMTTPTEDKDTAGLMLALALRHRYEWAVNIGFGAGPTIRFATDPTGLKAIFRLRDVAPDRSRRDALLAWITDHWRLRREDPEIETYVRQHLRGAVRFSWNGMSVEVAPAPLDVDRRDAIAAEREAMRLAGTDRRARAASAAGAPGEG